MVTEKDDGGGWQYYFNNFSYLSSTYSRCKCAEISIVSMFYLHADENKIKNGFLLSRRWFNPSLLLKEEAREVGFCPSTETVDTHLVSTYYG